MIRAMERRDPFEDDEVEAAASEAAGIGGVAGDEDLPPEDRPLVEAGQGEAEGFELAEQDLIEHASHGDEHSGRMAIYHAGRTEEAGQNADFGEGDDVQSSQFDPEDLENAAKKNEAAERERPESP
jgi:hypothetical protein